MNRYDTIIIGAGIAGLFTALRLSKNGQKVLVVEKDKVGSGATIANHGTIHSGAHYMVHYPEIVKSCIEAQDLFLNLFPTAKLLSKNSIHIVKGKNYPDFERLLKHNQFEYKIIKPDHISELKPNILKNSKFVSLREEVYSSREILDILISYCLANGVKFLLGNKIQKIKSESECVVGICIGSNELIKAKNVIVATGMGTEGILNSINSYYSKYLKSRVGMMAYLPNMHTIRGFVFMEPVKPVLLPALGNGTLASIFGMILPPVTKVENFSVDYEKARLIIKGIKQNFNVSEKQTSGATFYVSGKTDYVNEDNINSNSVNPGYNIIDHGEFDRINGLYTIITGKMTLAFHSSKNVSEKILKKDLSLDINQKVKTKYDRNMLEIEPWNNFNQN